MRSCFGWVPNSESAVGQLCTLLYKFRCIIHVLHVSAELDNHGLRLRVFGEYFLRRRSGHTIESVGIWLSQLSGYNWDWPCEYLNLIYSRTFVWLWQSGSQSVLTASASGSYSSLITPAPSKSATAASQTSMTKSSDGARAGCYGWLIYVLYSFFLNVFLWPEAFWSAKWGMDMGFGAGKLLSEYG